MDDQDAHSVAPYSNLVGRTGYRFILLRAQCTVNQQARFLIELGFKVHEGLEIEEVWQLDLKTELIPPRSHDGLAGGRRGRSAHVSKLRYRV